MQDHIFTVLGSPPGTAEGTPHLQGSHGVRHACGKRTSVWIVLLPITGGSLRDPWKDCGHGAEFKGTDQRIKGPQSQVLPRMEGSGSPGGLHMQAMMWNFHWHARAATCETKHWKRWKWSKESCVFKFYMSRELIIKRLSGLAQGGFLEYLLNRIKCATIQLGICFTMSARTLEELEYCTKSHYCHFSVHI